MDPPSQSFQLPAPHALDQQQEQKLQALATPKQVIVCTMPTQKETLDSLARKSYDLRKDADRLECEHDEQERLVVKRSHWCLLTSFGWSVGSVLLGGPKIFLLLGLLVISWWSIWRLDICAYRLQRTQWRLGEIQRRKMVLKKRIRELEDKEMVIARVFAHGAGRPARNNSIRRILGVLNRLGGDRVHNDTWFIAIYYIGCLLCVVRSFHFICSY